MDIFKLKKPAKTEDREEDFRRIDSEALKHFEAEGGSRGGEDDGDASGANSSFSLGSARPAAPISQPRSRSGVASKKNNVSNDKNLWPMLKTQFLRPKML